MVHLDRPFINRTTRGYVLCVVKREMETQTHQRGQFTGIITLLGHVNQSFHTCLGTWAQTTTTWLEIKTYSKLRIETEVLCL